MDEKLDEQLQRIQRERIFYRSLGLPEELITKIELTKNPSIYTEVFAGMSAKELDYVVTLEIERRILETVQSAYMADPAAMRALAVNRVPCNGLLADHPSVIVQPLPVRPHVPTAAHHEIGLLGLLNGIMCDLGCTNVLAMTFEAADPTDDHERLFTGFKLTPRTT